MDNKTVLLSTVCKYYFSPSHFCVTTLPLKANRPTVRHNFRAHVSPDSAEPLVRRGRITNYPLIARSYSNTFALNYLNRCALKLQCAKSVSFVETQCARLVYV